MPRLTRKLIETLEPREGDYSVRDTEAVSYTHLTLPTKA